MLLALSEALITGLSLAVVAIITGLFGVVAIKLNRSTRDEAVSANDGIDSLLDVIIAANRREAACLEALASMLTEKNEAVIRAREAQTEVEALLVKATASRKARNRRVAT